MTLGRGDDDETWEEALQALIVLGLVVDSGKRDSAGRVLWTLALAQH